MLLKKNVLAALVPRFRPAVLSGWPKSDHTPAISTSKVGQEDSATVPKAPGKAPPRAVVTAHVGVCTGAEDLPRRPNQVGKRAG